MLYEANHEPNAALERKVLCVGSYEQTTMCRCIKPYQLMDQIQNINSSLSEGTNEGIHHELVYHEVRLNGRRAFIIPPSLCLFLLLPI